jgi:16S rRNA (cytosine1402-N4)-methyltransferase
VNPVEHTPVMVAEVLECLAVERGHSFIDATVGLGGHAAAILDASAPDGRVLGLDADPVAVERARTRLQSYKGRAVIVQGNFRDLRTIAAANNVLSSDGVLFDLGVSSLQLGPTGRGFSFQYPAPLDMRMDPGLTRTAAELVNSSDEAELSAMLRRFGEEPAARRIARAITANRPITLTTDLARIVSAVAGRPGDRLHPATRTFQALRIAVNDELSNLTSGLKAALAVLCQGGRLVVITFHSLEDRLVKEFLRHESRDCICPPGLPACVCGHRASIRLIHRKVIRPDAAEVSLNPRSRSAKLRVAERI